MKLKFQNLFRPFFIALWGFAALLMLSNCQQDTEIFEEMSSTTKRYEEENYSSSRAKDGSWWEKVWDVACVDGAGALQGASLVSQTGMGWNPYFLGGGALLGGAGASIAYAGITAPDPTASNDNFYSEIAANQQNEFDNIGVEHNKIVHAYLTREDSVSSYFSIIEQYAERNGYQEILDLLDVNYFSKQEKKVKTIETRDDILKMILRHLPENVDKNYFADQFLDIPKTESWEEVFDKIKAFEEYYLNTDKLDQIEVMKMQVFFATVRHSFYYWSIIEDEEGRGCTEHDFPRFPKLVCPINPNNKYDHFGKGHNMGLDHLLEYKKEITKIAKDKKKVVIFISKKVLENLDIKVGSIPKSLLESIVDPDFILKSEGSITDAIKQSVLNDFEKEILLSLVKQTKSVIDISSANTFIKNAIALENKLVDNEQIEHPALLFGTISTLKYSTKYWLENPDWLMKADIDFEEIIQEDGRGFLTGYEAFGEIGGNVFGAVYSAMEYINQLIFESH